MTVTHSSFSTGGTYFPHNFSYEESALQLIMKESNPQQEEITALNKKKTQNNFNVEECASPGHCPAMSHSSDSAETTLLSREDEKEVEHEKKESNAEISQTTANDSDEEDDDSNLLFVGDLSKTISEDDLREAFTLSNTVKVVEVQLKRSKVTKQSLGYGFVRLASAAEAERAISELNQVIGRVQLARQNTKLHIGNLALQVTTEDLTKLFSPFGPLYEEDTRIFKTGRGGNFAQVHFVNRKDACAAKKKLSGATFKDQKALHVEWNVITSSRQHDVDEDAPLQDSFASHRLHDGSLSLESGPVISLYVQFETVEDDVCVEEELLRKIFKQFGDVTSVCIKNFSIDPVTGQQRGYAFVHYSSSQEGRDSAYAAVMLSEREVVINGVHLTIEFSKNFRKGVEQLSRGSSLYQDSDYRSTRGNSHLNSRGRNKWNGGLRNHNSHTRLPYGQPSNFAGGLPQPFSPMHFSAENMMMGRPHVSGDFGVPQPPVYMQDSGYYNVSYPSPVYTRQPYFGAPVHNQYHNGYLPDNLGGTQHDGSGLGQGQYPSVENGSGPLLVSADDQPLYDYVDYGLATFTQPEYFHGNNRRGAKYGHRRGGIEGSWRNSNNSSNSGNN